MPKIAPEQLDSTFYLYESVEDARKGSRFGGTGFFVGYPTGNSYFPILLYAVTNWHVAVRDGASVMRINKIGGGVEILEFDPSNWEFLPSGPDLAVIPPAMLSLKEGTHAVVALHLDMLLTREDIATLEIGPGEDVFMIGRFVDHDGAASNVPSVRFGNISVMPQKVPQPTGATDLTSFILDVHSRTGYSGSPVFVYRTFGSDLTTNEMGKDLIRSEYGLVAAPHRHFVKLLGLHWGQFPEQWEIKSKAKTFIGEVRLHAEARYIEGMSGMTLALPAWQIRDFLEMKKFKEPREQAINRIREAVGQGPIAESSIAPASDANPTHREDFRRLLGEAVKKSPPDSSGNP